MQITRYRAAPGPSSFIGSVHYLVLLVALARAGVACTGCQETRLSRYEPQGPSARLDSLQSLENKLQTHLVYYPTAVDLTPEDTERALIDVSDVIDEHMRLRPTNPGFRSLCALLNTYYGEWKRLIILERLEFADNAYGFFVIAETPRGPRAVTNLVQDEHLVWNAATSLREIQVAAQPFEDIRAELDKAKSILPQCLLGYDNIDWPLYVLHDIKDDGDSFSFAVWGYGAGDIEDVEKMRADYVKASELIRQGDCWEAVAFASPRGQQLCLAGKAYAVLLSQVWQVALGKTDHGILGGSSRK